MAAENRTFLVGPVGGIIAFCQQLLKFVATHYIHDRSIDQYCSTPTQACSIGIPLAFLASIGQRKLFSWQFSADFSVSNADCVHVSKPLSEEDLIFMAAKLSELPEVPFESFLLPSHPWTIQDLQYCKLIVRPWVINRIHAANFQYTRMTADHPQLQFACCFIAYHTLSWTNFGIHVLLTLLSCLDWLYCWCFLSAYALIHFVRPMWSKIIPFYLWCIIFESWDLASFSIVSWYCSPTNHVAHSLANVVGNQKMTRNTPFPFVTKEKIGLWRLILRQRPLHSP